MKRSLQAAAVFGAACVACSGWAQVGTTTRLSISSAGAQGNGGSWSPAMSPNGRHFAFQSQANNLVADDTNGLLDIFVRDRSTGITERASLGEGGVQSNGVSDAATISADGRFVAFTSAATNLVPSDTNGFVDCFVRDLLLDTTRRISIATGGEEANAACAYPWISSNGRYVTFHSAATNLVADDTNNQSDVFMHDLHTFTTVRVSVSEGGIQGDGRSEFASTSGDGRYVVFHSGATTLAVDDTNGFWDILVKDMSTGEVYNASVSSDGVQGNGHSGGAGIGENGRYVVFSTEATNLAGVDANGVRDSYLHDLTTGETDRVSITSTGDEGSGESIGPVVSQDGRIVAFSSIATDLTPEDTNNTWDVFIRDRLTNKTELVSKSTGGVQGSDASHGPIITADGLEVGFQSLAPNLIANDTNNNLDAFLHNRRAWIVPSAMSLFRGTTVSGDLNSLLVSDNDRLVLQPGVVLVSSEAPIQLILDTTSPFETCTGLAFEIEWHASAPSINQTISLFNFGTGQYELLATTPNPGPDTFTRVVVIGDPLRFVGPSGGLRARVAFKAGGPVLVYPWQARVDVVRWIVSP